MYAGRTESETQTVANSTVVGDCGDVITGTESGINRNEAQKNSTTMIGWTSTCNVHMFLHHEDVRNLIPEFVPEKINVEKWLRKIDDLKSLYGWEERAVLHYARIRLGPVSRMWFEGLEESVCGWEDFKRRIIRAFPSRIDEVNVHRVLMKRVKQSFL